MLNPLSLIPSWAYAAAVVALGAALSYSEVMRQREVAAHARDNAQAAKRQADAVQAEIDRHNAQAASLRKVAADATERAQAATQAASETAQALKRSEDALAAGAAVQRRLRDANATGILAAEQAIAAARTAGQCAPAIEAARVRAELFDEIDAAAGRIERSAVRLAGHARASSEDADRTRVAADTCVRADAVTR